MPSPPPLLRALRALLALACASPVANAATEPAPPPIRGFMTARAGFDPSPAYFAKIKSRGANAVRLQVAVDRYAEMRKTTDIRQHWRWLTDLLDISKAYGWSWTNHAFRESQISSLEHGGEF